MKILGIYLLILFFIMTILTLVGIARTKELKDIKIWVITILILYFPNIIFIFNFLINYKT
jgi:hypothetical protein